MRLGQGPLTRRILGVPWLFAVAYAAVGFSLYFSIGVVADHGLGLTPLIFLAAGLLFVLATLSYLEGGAMFLERGGSATLARHAFNELISFIAGWAILIDYVIVIALAAISVPHYLSPIWDGFTHGWAEIAVTAAVIVFTAGVNIAGFTGQVRQRRLIVLALADIVLQLAVIAVGAIVVFHPDLLTANLDLFTTPSAGHIFEALAVATLAFAGIEAASDLAPDLKWEPRDLRRVVSSTAVLLPLIYAGMAAVALMAVPVVPGPDGPQTALGERFIEEPVLGVVMSYDPSWLSTVLQVAVVAIAPVVLAWAASTSMLGLSRHVYVLATNRQVPSWLGKLGQALDSVCGDLGSGGDRVRDRRPGRHPPAGGDLRLRRHAGDRHRPPVGGPAALDGPRSRPSVPDAVRRHGPGAQASRCRRSSGAVADAAAVDRGAHLPRERALGGRRLDAVRPGRLRGLPAVRREDVADQARLGAGGGAPQGGPRGRVRRHPGAGLRDQARRRHRQHRGPPGRRRRPAGRAAAPGSR